MTIAVDLGHKATKQKKHVFAGWVKIVSLSKYFCPLKGADQAAQRWFERSLCLTFIDLNRHDPYQNLSRQL